VYISKLEFARVQKAITILEICNKHIVKTVEEKRSVDVFPIHSFLNQGDALLPYDARKCGRNGIEWGTSAYGLY
jgi:hypothetical protein